MFERARIRDAGENEKATFEIQDYLSFFHLRQFQLRQGKDDLRVIAFKPGGDKYGHLVTVEVAIDSPLKVCSTMLMMARDFIDSPADGPFAWDLAKSFLMAASSSSERPALQELIGEIRLPPKETSNIARAVFFTGIGNIEIVLGPRKLAIRNLWTAGERMLVMEFTV